MKITSRIIFFTALVLILILSVSSQAVALDLENFFDLNNESELSEGFYTMVDQEGNMLMRTSRIIHVGDEYITGDNRVFRVVRIEGLIAEARYLRSLSYDRVMTPGGSLTTVGKWFRGLQARVVPVQQQDERKIAIYHSHGAEAYVPSDGAESVDEGGGIIQVGDAFSSALEDSGVETLKSDETHVPHDAGAYQRSRRTAEEFAKENPDALFDVHRDAVPPEEYTAEIEGEEKVQVQLVVGRQNQNMATNREFAEELKATADNMYPNLVKGIFMARGSYNQDMSPRAMLLEVGAHENTREDAEESVTLFADVVNTYLYDTDEGQEFLAPGGTEGPQRTALRSALWIIGFLILAVGGYLLISVGGIDEIKKKLNQFTKSEFTNFLGSFKKETQDGSAENQEENQEGHEGGEGHDQNNPEDDGNS